MIGDKKVILSGIQPSGDSITLGNYLGALNNWVKLQSEYRCLYMLADMHTLTVRQEPSQLRARTLSLLAQYIAAGLNPQENILFIQSHVPAHAELTWILNCYTQMGELGRMTQFKDKSKRHADNINAGLYDYPVLMAADILLYQADMVPVGTDQKQHVELARDIAQRFNGVHGDVFTIPEPYIAPPSAGSKIKSLQDPTAKMSKSDPNPNGCIFMLDPPEVVIKKIKRAVTDSEAEVAYREGKDGVNNLLTIYAAVTGKSVEDAVSEFAGKGYGDFKAAVGEAVAECLRPFQLNYRTLMNSKDYLESVYKDGAEQAGRIAERTLNKVKKKVGFVPR
ncbi:MAG: tryptophan--tRNA ligase [Oscillospiraceae bacterium]|nr:tryptophan--tRNA ligase [Oscillospiraceae bacterium]